MLSELSELPHDELVALANKIEVQSASEGTKLLSRGDQDSCRLYLLKGTLSLQAGDGGVKLVSDNEPSARAPIARLRPSRYDVVAATDVDFLRLDAEILDWLDSSLDTVSTTLDTYHVEESEQHGQRHAENRMTLQIYQDLNHDQLLLPSLPDIAIRVGQTLNHDYADANRVARVIENDPTIAAKILKAANSARYAGNHPVGRLKDAITRIGLDTTHHLVITFALRELFRSNSKQLNKRMRQVWEHSRRVASIAHVLAQKWTKLDPDTALLAGLIHDIGSVAILSYARDFPEVIEQPALLDDALSELHAQLGNMILVKWHLPDYLAQIPSQSNHWDREHTGPCDFVDLIIVARLHALIDSDKQAELPDFAHVPAYAKLGIVDDTPESSLLILDEAHDEIKDTAALLGP
jgi:HD-like signal output (HDOD) protein